MAAGLATERSFLLGKVERAGSVLGGKEVQKEKGRK